MTDSKNNIRRFYKEVNIVQRDNTFSIELDGQTVKTPSGQPQVMISEALAKAIAYEWSSQEKIVVPETMPMSGYANTAIDRIGKNRQSILKEMLSFAETDLLCYRIDEPKDLASRQKKHWQPLLDWAADTMGVELEVTVGILPVKQPVEAIEALAHRLQKLGDMELAGIASLTTICGSVILALALAVGKIDAKHAFNCSQLDQIYQNERWGVDEETGIHQLRLEKDIASAALFLSLLRLK
tara:strand:- start:319 stop:1038 length:720 start_codon:yes stop_codon:yes gene_type:complete